MQVNAVCRSTIKQDGMLNRMGSGLQNLLEVEKNVFFFSFFKLEEAVFFLFLLAKSGRNSFFVDETVDVSFTQRHGKKFQTRNKQMDRQILSSVS